MTPTKIIIHMNTRRIRLMVKNHQTGDVHKVIVELYEKCFNILLVDKKLKKAMDDNKLIIIPLPPLGRHLIKKSTLINYTH